MKWVLKYLKRLADVGIMYQRDGNSGETTGYMYLDHNGDLDDRRSLAEYVLSLAGGAVSWKAFFQDDVALSSTETEYMTLIFVAKEVILYLELQEKSVIMHCDN